MIIQLNDAAAVAVVTVSMAAVMITWALVSRGK